jgi:hypothetical protein
VLYDALAIQSLSDAVAESGSDIGILGAVAVGSTEQRYCTVSGTMAVNGKQRESKQAELPTHVVAKVNTI